MGAMDSSSLVFVMAMYYDLGQVVMLSISFCVLLHPSILCIYLHSSKHHLIW